MPYCPKCDMEFVEGIKICSDCGGPLMESKEVADAMKQKEKEEQLAVMAQEMDPFSGEMAKTEDADPDEISSAKKKPADEIVHAYVDKGQRYEDMSSSASAFFLVGGVLAVGAALCLLGVFHLPMEGFQKYIFEGALVILAVASLGRRRLLKETRRRVKSGSRRRKTGDSGDHRLVLKELFRKRTR